MQHNIEARSHNNCFRGTAMSITYSECVFVALGIQHVMRMRRVILFSVASPAVLSVPTLPHKRPELGQKGTESNTCALTNRIYIRVLLIIEHSGDV